MFRVQGESNWQSTEPETQEDFLDIGGLQPDTSYEMRIVAVDGEFEEDSPSQMVNTSDVGEY